MSTPTADGRTGRVPAGCVFWIRGTTSTFARSPRTTATAASDASPHRLATLEEVATNDDVETLLGSGWVTGRDAAGLPSVSGRPDAVTYGPLGDPAGVVPDVVMLRVNGRQLVGALRRHPGPRHRRQAPVPHRRDRQGTASPGGERRLRPVARPHRHGPRGDDLPLPATSLENFVAAVERTAETDSVVARYTASDTRRFGD